MYASCLRFEGYKAQRTSGWYDAESLRSQCASRDTAVAGVLAANRVLSAYFSALAKLADDQIISADREIGGLAAIVKRSGLDDAQIDAVAGLTKYLTSAAIDTYRRGRIGEAVASQNENVVLVTKGLRSIINRDYRQILNIEGRAANDFYRVAVTENREREPLAAILVLKDRDDRVAELRKKTEAVDAYVRALDAVRAGHQKLYDHRNTLPNTGFSVRIPGEQLFHIDGRPREMFAPQIPVEQLGPGVDVALETARKLLGQSR
ncbi:MAG: hypothetical protein Q7S20_08960 [Gemmatimonadaceae bacterium]|nr:hypothetical protein [Gemmatimonadaceae bacterium]